MPSQFNYFYKWRFEKDRSLKYIKTLTIDPVFHPMMQLWLNNPTRIIMKSRRLSWYGRIE